MCVLASGDPGFFGIVRALGAAVGPRAARRPSRAVVGRASPSPASALPWDDALVVSAHGRDPRPAVHAALRHPKVAVLTEPRAPAADIVAALAGSGRTVTVAEALGTPRRAAAHGRRPRRWPARAFAEPNVVVVFDAGRRTWPPRTPDRWALPEERVRAPRRA